jgi:hypothetical protein
MDDRQHKKRCSGHKKPASLLLRHCILYLKCNYLQIYTKAVSKHVYVSAEVLSTLININSELLNEAFLRKHVFKTRLALIG